MAIFRRDVGGYAWFDPATGRRRDMPRGWKPHAGQQAVANPFRAGGQFHKGGNPRSAPRRNRNDVAQNRQSYSGVDFDRQSYSAGTQHAGIEPRIMLRGAGEGRTVGLAPTVPVADAWMELLQMANEAKRSAAPLLADIASIEKDNFGRQRAANQVAKTGWRSGKGATFGEMAGAGRWGRSGARDSMLAALQNQLAAQRRENRLTLGTPAVQATRERINREYKQPILDYAARALPAGSSRLAQLTKMLGGGQ